MEATWLVIIPPATAVSTQKTRTTIVFVLVHPPTSVEIIDAPSWLHVSTNMTFSRSPHGVSGSFCLPYAPSTIIYLRHVKHTNFLPRLVGVSSVNSNTWFRAQPYSIFSAIYNPSHSEICTWTPSSPHDIPTFYYSPERVGPHQYKNNEDNHWKFL